MSSLFKSSLSSTSSAVKSTAQVIAADKHSVYTQAVNMIYKSSLTLPQSFAAVKIFIDQPLMAETYLSTPEGIRDQWILLLITPEVSIFSNLKLIPFQHH